MANVRIKDLANTATTVASDAFLAVDGVTNGTEKITRDNFRTDTAAAFVAAPGTYNLAPLSGGAVPIANGGTAAITAAGARTSLDVPSTSETVLVANNLSDVTAATARTNLSVNSKDEDAQANATKTTAPALYFDGAASVVTVADDDKFSFTDGTDDLPFSISGWVKMGDATNFCIASKFLTGTGTEFIFRFNDSDKLALIAYSDASNYWEFTADNASTSKEGEWVHVAVSYAGAGPNSDVAFSAATATLYINGETIASSNTQTGTYAGISNTAQPLWIGRYQFTYSEGSIRDVKIFNRELTASEVAELARGNDLGFADEWAGSLGGAYASDFSAGVDGWVVLSNITLTGNVDSIGGGVNDNLRLVPNTTNGQHSIYKNTLTQGKRFRVSFDYYIPSANSNIDGFRVTLGSAGDISNVVSATTDLWTRHEFEGVCDAGSGLLLIYATDGGNTTFQDAGGDDTMYIRNVKATEIGTLADFRSEDYNESASKLLDRSSNNFVGVGTSVTLTGNQRHISADTIDLKNLPTSSAGLSAGEVWSNSGVLTVV